MTICVIHLHLCTVNIYMRMRIYTNTCDMHAICHTIHDHLTTWLIQIASLCCRFAALSRELPYRRSTASSPVPSLPALCHPSPYLSHDMAWPSFSVTPSYIKETTASSDVRPSNSQVSGNEWFDVFKLIAMDEEPSGILSSYSLLPVIQETHYE